MIKVNLSSLIIDNFKAQVLSNFFDINGNKIYFTKKEDKKIKWQITLEELNVLIKKKFKGYKYEITLEKLITMKYDELCELKDFIDNNKMTGLKTKKEKDYFDTLYSRLNKAKYIKDLDISVCPYCNRNYILNFTKK